MGGTRLLIDEYLETADPRLVDEVLAASGPGFLKALGQRWYADPRPEVRPLLHQLLLRGADLPDHRALVKTVLKAAEKAGDDATLGHLLVAFDRFDHRVLVPRYRFDGASGTAVRSEALVIQRGLRRRQPEQPQGRPQAAGRPVRFSVVTRRYLQRRAWRWFRKLAWKEPERYLAGLLQALRLYPEEALDSPRKLIDAWGLMQALYHGCPALQFRPRGVVVAPGRSLQELAPAPYRAELWAGKLDELLGLFLEARSNAVRQWALQLLRRDVLPSLAGVPLAVARRLLDHPSPEAQALGAELLERSEGLATLPIGDWLQLLQGRSPEAVGRVCALVVKHVAPDRLSWAQCLELARSPAAPVAELGLGWARARPVSAPGQLEALLALAEAPVEPVRTAATTWALELLAREEAPRCLLLARELLDARFPEVRARVLVLMAAEPRFGQATLLWAAMAESPWPEVREALVERLRRAEGGLSFDQLRTVWATSLLAIARGGRARRAVPAQVAARVVARPEEAAALVPLLGLALRSVRPPERRAALVALTRAVGQAPALEAELARAVPELRFAAAGAQA